MGVFFLLVGLLVAITAYVVIKVVTVIVSALRKKKYGNAAITAAVLLCFFAFLYVAYVKMHAYADKVLSEGLR